VQTQVASQEYPRQQNVRRRVVEAVHDGQLHVTPEAVGQIQVLVNDDMASVWLLQCEPKLCGGAAVQQQAACDSARDGEGMPREAANAPRQ